MDRALGVFLNILIIVVIIIALLPAWKKPQLVTNGRYRFAMLLFVVFCLFPFFSGDFLHYEDLYDYYLKTGVLVHLEDIYQYVIDISYNSYTIFRLILWGGGIIIFARISKILGINKKVFFLVLIGAFVTKYSYARVSIAMVLMFFGMAILVSNNNKKLSNCIFGLLVLASSYLFHRSALFGVAVILISMLLIRINKLTIAVAFLSIPILIIVARTFLADYLQLRMEEDSLVDVSHSQRYLQSDYGTSMGPGQLLSVILERTPYYLSAYMFVKLVLSGAYSKWPRAMRAFANASFLVIFISTMMLFDLGANTKVIYYRFLSFTYIPTTVFVCYCHSVGLHRKLTKYILYTGIASTVYMLVYALYCQLM